MTKIKDRMMELAGYAFAIMIIGIIMSPPSPDRDQFVIKDLFWLVPMAYLVICVGAMVFWAIYEKEQPDKEQTETETENVNEIPPEPNIADKETDTIITSENDMENFVKLMESILEFINEVNITKEPRIAKLQSIATSDSNEFGVIHLWAGYDSNPIERIGHLRNQITELKRLLEIAMKGDISKDDYELMVTTLRIFE